jgi:hypothetical protein
MDYTKVDALMRSRRISFFEACKCHRLIRNGRTADQAVEIINMRKKRKEEKKMKKAKKTESLETLVGLLNEEATGRELVNAFRLVEVCARTSPTAARHWGKVLSALCTDDETPEWDAMRHLDERSCESMNSFGGVDSDTKELMESNQDSLGMWS